MNIFHVYVWFLSLFRLSRLRCLQRCSYSQLVKHGSSVSSSSISLALKHSTVKLAIMNMQQTQINGCLQTLQTYKLTVVIIWVELRNLRNESDHLVTRDSKLLLEESVHLLTWTPHLFPETETFGKTQMLLLRSPPDWVLSATIRVPSVLDSLQKDKLIFIFKVEKEAAVLIPTTCSLLSSTCQVLLLLNNKGAMFSSENNYKICRERKKIKNTTGQAKKWRE